MRSFWTKWGLCSLLFLATILNYLNRQTLSLLAPTLQHEMHMGNEALGWLFAVFYYSYTLFQFAVGPVLDRFNIRWCFALAVFAWSLVSGMTGLATGFAGLLVFRLLLGVMESANWPASLRIVARVFPPEERTLASGIFTSGTSVAALIAPGLILAILAVAGWRWAFAAVGSLGFFWVALWLFSTRRPELSTVWSSTAAERQEAQGLGSVYSQLVRSEQFWYVLVVAVLVNPCLYYSVNWLPTYFAQARGLAPGRQLGWILTLTYLALDLGNIACGAMALWLTRLSLSVQSARRIVFLSATVFVGACALVPFVRAISSAVLALVVVNFGLGIWVSMYLTMAQEVSRTHISTAAGTLSAFGSLVGALAMWAVGRITQRTGSFMIPMVSVAVAVAVSAIAGWAASRQPPEYLPEGKV
jgi:MFS transporter, ACS family, aldohexuronate transporter